VFKFGDSIDHGSLTKCRISLNFTLIYSSFQDASFDVNSCPVTLLVLEKNEKKNQKNSYVVFKFADSIDHCSLLKYRIPFSFTLLDSSLQCASFFV
jgi:hypothetical protein